jgi:hypothetical protein
MIRKLVMKLARLHRKSWKSKDFFDKNQVWIIGHWAGGRGRPWPIHLFKQIAAEHVQVLVIHETWTTQRCYWCSWFSGDWNKKVEPGQKKSETWARCKETSDIPSHLPEKTASRYKHDHLKCSFRDRGDGHPYHIYRDGGAAVNILHLAYYLCIQVMKHKIAKQEIHENKHRPACFQTKSKFK